MAKTARDIRLTGEHKPRTARFVPNSPFREFALSPPRKPPEPGDRRQVFVRLPEDVATRIDAKAKAMRLPFNRIVINELAEHPYLEMQRGLDETLHDMKITLAQYGARLTVTSLSEGMLQAIDEIIAAPTAADRDAPLDKLRVLRSAMIKQWRQVTKMEREQQAAHIALMERQLAAVEKLPDGNILRDGIPGSRDRIEDLKRAQAVTDPDRRKAAE